MKKCLIFFTLLLITIAIAVVTQQQENISAVNDVVRGESPPGDLAIEEQIVALD